MTILYFVSFMHFPPPTVNCGHCYQVAGKTGSKVQLYSDKKVFSANWLWSVLHEHFSIWNDSDKKQVSTDANICNDAQYVSEGTINNIDGENLLQAKGTGIPSIAGFKYNNLNKSF